jgi:hypothetical protein
MAALYRCWSGRRGVDLVQLTRGFFPYVGRAESPIGQVCLQVANEITTWGGKPYHSVNHHAEVATNAMVIAEITRRIGSPIRLHRFLLLASSLAHDIYYEPPHGPLPRFAAEAVSARALDAICSRFGVEGADRAALRCLILATEPGFRACLSGLLSGSDVHDQVPAALRLIVEQTDLIHTAAVLSDADLLSSFGLTEKWHRVQIGRLEHEIDSQITPTEDLLFVEQVVGPAFLSPGAHIFSANLTQICRAIRQSLGAVSI